MNVSFWALPCRMRKNALCRQRRQQHLCFDFYGNFEKKIDQRQWQRPVDDPRDSFDSEGNIYVADTGNCIAKFQDGTFSFFENLGQARGSLNHRSVFGLIKTTAYT